MSTEHALIHTRCVFGHLPTRGEIRSVSVWPLTHQRRNLCGHLLTGSELCLFGHFTYSPERNSVCLATYSLKEKIYLFGCVITYRRRNTHSAFVWPLSHQCLFGHFLTSVCLATFSPVFGHLLTKVCLATYSPVCLATYSPVSGHLHIRVCVATYSPVCVWPLTRGEKAQCFGHFLTSVWPLTHQSLFGHLLTSVFGHLLTSVWSLTHQSLFGHLLTSVWSLTHQSLFGHLLTNVFGHLLTSVWSLTHQSLSGHLLTRGEKAQCFGMSNTLSSTLNVWSKYWVLSTDTSVIRNNRDL